MKKHLWLFFLPVLPFSLWIVTGHGPHWKPFLSRDASMALLLLLVIGLTWSSLRRRRTSSETPKPK